MPRPAVRPRPARARERRGSSFPGTSVTPASCCRHPGDEARAGGVTGSMRLSANTRASGAPVQTNEAERRRWNDQRWVSVWPKRERMTDAVSPFVLEAAALRAGRARARHRLRRRPPLARGGARRRRPRFGRGRRPLRAAARARRAARARGGADNVEVPAARHADRPHPGRPVRRRDQPVRRDVLRRPRRRPSATSARISRRTAGSRSRAGSGSRTTRGTSRRRSRSSFPPAPPRRGTHRRPARSRSPTRRAPREILTAAGFRDVRRRRTSSPSTYRRTAIFDDIQLTLMGVAPEHHDGPRRPSRPTCGSSSWATALSRAPARDSRWSARTIRSA